MARVMMACAVPRCPRPAAYRGRCEAHRQNTTARGYGASHQDQRAAALPGARCVACGCSEQLNLDHRLPALMGGSDRWANKRWLCACAEHTCHQRLGRRRDRPLFRRPR